MPRFQKNRRLMGRLSDVGDITGLLGSVIGMGLAAIVLLTFAPTVVGDINVIALQSISHCKIEDGELIDRVVEKNGHATADLAWAGSTTNIRVIFDTEVLECKVDGLSVASTGEYFTSKGTPINVVAGTTTSIEYVVEGGEWESASIALTSLAQGSLMTLLFGTMAILLPAGALGFLGYFGAQLVHEHIGGGAMFVAIGSSIAVVIIGTFVPLIFEPLDALFLALDGNRYYIYSQGIGQLGGLLGNFLGVSLIGGLITLGFLLWQGVGRNGRGTRGIL